MYLRTVLVIWTVWIYKKNNNNKQMKPGVCVNISARHVKLPQTSVWYLHVSGLTRVFVRARVPRAPVTTWSAALLWGVCRNHWRERWENTTFALLSYHSWTVSLKLLIPCTCFPFLFRVRRMRSMSTISRVCWIARRIIRHLSLVNQFGSQTCSFFCRSSSRLCSLDFSHPFIPSSFIL